jgi:hypothetical protein
LEEVKMKVRTVKLITVFICLVTINLILVSQISAKVDLKSAAGIWVFNENKGEVAKDLTANANNGTLKGSPKWTDGKFDKGLELDGKGAYIEVAKSDSMSITDKITIVAWVYPYTYGQGGKKAIDAADGKSVNIMSKMENASSYVGPFWWEYRNNGQVNAYFAAPPANTYLTPTIPNLPVDKWSHIAATFDSSTGTAIVYLDGVLIQTLTTAGFGPLRAGVELIIGSGKGGADYGKPFNGKMDEVAIFNATLAKADIESVMNDGLERVLGLTAVQPSGKLAANWGSIKSGF